MKPARSMITFVLFPFVMKIELQSEIVMARSKYLILQREKKSLTFKVTMVESAA